MDSLQMVINQFFFIHRNCLKSRRIRRGSDSGGGGGNGGSSRRIIRFTNAFLELYAGDA